MVKLSDLLEERSRIAKAMRALHAEADKDGKLSAEQQAKFDAMKADLESVEARIQRQQTIDDLERRMQGQQIHEAGNDELSREKRKFSITKLIASAFERTVDAAREREICQEQRNATGRQGEGFLIPFDCLAPDRRQMEQRVLVQNGGTGGYLVSETVLGNEFIDALRPMAVSTLLGARVITGLVGDIALPKRSSRTPTAAWFLENSSITTGDQAFTQVQGRPKHLGLITEFSRKMLLQATPGIEQLTREHLLRELAIGLDYGVLKGTGIGAQPYGITASSPQEVDMESGDPTWEAVTSVVASVEAADVPPTSLGWALNAFTKAKLRATTKVADDAGGGFLMTDDGRIAGLPTAVTSQLVGMVGTSPATDGEAIFGAWDQVIVGMWSGMEILVNPYESTAYGKGNVSVRGIVDAAVMVRHDEAFCWWKNVKVDPAGA